MKYIMKALSVVLCFISLNAFQIKSGIGFRYFRLFGFKNKNWLELDNELIISKTIENNELEDWGLFDSIYKEEIDSKYRSHSISKLSLKDIAEAYQFSLAYLGDFVMEMGCRGPIDIELQIGSYLNGEQIYTLLQAITTLDPYDSNSGYDSMSINELAESLKISKLAVVEVCKDEGINLPFGSDTTLHYSVVEQIKGKLEYIERLPDDDQDDDDDDFSSKDYNSDIF